MLVQSGRARSRESRTRRSRDGYIARAMGGSNEDKVTWRETAHPFLFQVTPLEPLLQKTGTGPTGIVQLGRSHQTQLSGNLRRGPNRHIDRLVAFPR